jgi:hypothetical protein
MTDSGMSLGGSTPWMTKTHTMAASARAASNPSRTTADRRSRLRMPCRAKPTVA